MSSGRLVPGAAASDAWRIGRPSGRFSVALDIKALVDVERGSISRAILWNPEIYALELERVFARCWLFLGHESQIARPGDYVTTWMADEPIILARDAAGDIHAMINSCRHRGNRVCWADQGRGHSFMCHYHGWTYGLDGRLVGVPGFEDRYYGELDRGEWGLIKVPHVESYKGLIFGTLDPQAPPLQEYLGDARWALDYVTDQRAGGTEVVGGVFKWIINSNWKLGADNIMGDNYHGAITHRSATMAGHQTAKRFDRRGGLDWSAGARPAGGASRRGEESNDRLRNRLGFTVPMAWGHGFMCDLQPVGDDAVTPDDPVKAYYSDTRSELEARLGPVRSHVWKINMTVFPNASFTTGSNMLHVWHPRGPDTTEVWLYVLVDRDAPAEVKRRIRQLAQRHFSPAGLFEQDDMDNWELSTQAAGGVVSRHYPLHYGMGRGHEEWVAGGGAPIRIPSINDESNQRAFYGGWAGFMSGKSWDDLIRERQLHEDSLREQATVVDQVIPRR